MGNLLGSVKSKARLEVGSEVVYTRKEAYKGLKGSPKFQDRLTVKEIFGTYITLEETGDIQFNIKDFFTYFVQVGKAKKK